MQRLTRPVVITVLGHGLGARSWGSAEPAQPTRLGVFRPGGRLTPASIEQSLRGARMRLGSKQLRHTSPHSGAGGLQGRRESAGHLGPILDLVKSDMPTPL